MKKVVKYSLMLAVVTVSRIIIYWGKKAKPCGKYKWLRKLQTNLCNKYTIWPRMSKISNLFWDQSQSDPANYLQERMMEQPTSHPWVSVMSGRCRTVLNCQEGSWFWDSISWVSTAFAVVIAHLSYGLPALHAISGTGLST